MPDTGHSPHRRQTGLALLIILAMLVALTILVNPSWVYTNPYDPPWFDPFIYQSLFERAPEIIARHPTYYPVNRIPHIAMGYLFYRLPDPVLANMLFKATLATLSATFVFAATRIVYGWRPALLAAVLLVVSPQALMTFGWDYIDSGVILISAMMYAAAVAAVYSARPALSAFIYGVLSANLLIMTLGSAFLVVSSTVFAVLLAYATGRLTNLFALRAIGMGFVGLIFGALLTSSINKALGGSFFVIQNQIEAAMQLSQSDSGYRIANWGYLLWDGAWNSFWLGTLVVGLIIFAKDVPALLRFIRADKADDADTVPPNPDETVLRFAGIAQFAVAAVSMIIITLVSLAVLAFWFYASFLFVPASIALAAITAPALNRIEIDRDLLWTIIGGLLLLALLLLAVAPATADAIQSMLGIRTLKLRAFWSAGMFAAGIGLLLVLARTNLPRLGLMALVVLFTAANASTMMLTQLDSKDSRDRKPGFVASYKARKAYIEAFPTGEGRFWFDRNEKPYGGTFYCGLRISTMTSDKELWRGW